MTHRAADGGPGGRAVPRAPVQRARRRRAAAVRRAASASSATATSPASARRCSQDDARPTPDGTCPTYQARNEQAMVHTAVGYARPAGPAADLGLHRLGRPRLDQHADRRRAGDHQPAPGAAAARRPSRPASPARCCRSSRTPYAATSPSTTRSGRCRASSTGSTAPSSCPSALLGAMRVLTDPVETGAVTLALPQDVQAEAFDWPDELFAAAGLARRPAGARAGGAGARGRGRSAAAAAAARRRRRRRALLRGRGGAARASPRRPASRSRETQAGKGSLPHGHPQAVGAVGVDRHDGRQRARRARRTSSSASARAGATSPPPRAPPSRTRTSASSTSTSRAFDAGKHVGRRRRGRRPRGADRAGRGARRVAVDAAYRARATRAVGASGTRRSTAAYDVPSRDDGPLLTQGQVLGAVNEVTDPRDVVLCAAGSMPGDLHKLWRVRDRKAYHVEYGYSCMGYEIAGGARGRSWRDARPRRRSRWSATAAT